jgi:hypothetical protein
MRLPLILLLATSAIAQQQVIGTIQSPDATVHGSVEVVSARTRLLSGSSVSAGAQVADVDLARGGELRVCPRSDVTLTASPSGKEMLVGIGSGALEMHYKLGANSDTLMTPDFRIQLPGPGEFHVAISTNGAGDTCVQSLAGSTASAVVNEVMGEGSYQLRPGQGAVFHAGRLDSPGPAANCGCPAAPIETAKESAFKFPEKESEAAAAAVATGQKPPDPPSAPLESGKTIVHMDAPFVFHADAPQASPPITLAKLSVEAMPFYMVPAPKPVPPPNAKKPGFFKRLFKAIFR